MKYKKLILSGLLFLQLSVWLCAATTAPTTTNGDYVVLLHGMIRSSTAMKRLEWAFERAGYRVINVSYPWSKLSIEDAASLSLAGILQERIQDPTAKINFVTHSIGGLIVREYLAHNCLTNLGRVVMIAPPNHGSELVDKFRKFPFYKFFTGPAGQQMGTDPGLPPNRLGPAHFDLGVIAGDSTLNPFYSMFLPGPDDGKVSVASARLDGMSDFLVVHSSHTYLPWRRQVVDASVQFIAEGKFPTQATRKTTSDQTVTGTTRKTTIVYASPKMQEGR